MFRRIRESAETYPKRKMKFTTPRLDIHQNAAELMQHPPLVYPTLYASSLITLNKSGYTKHYYEGSNRICSKIGGGFGNVDWDVVDSRIQPVEQASYDELHDRQQEGLWQTFSQCLHHDPEIMDHYDLRMVLDDYEKGRDDSEPAFYYHSDHLGSAAYLTNDAGQVTQTLNYLPYGEDWVDIQNFAETQYPRLGIYTFNGKEKDYESGYHYYGARYYWSELLTGWLSVDPMMDKYPDISPYNYCAWNPVMLVDPDGNDWVENKETGDITWNKNATSPSTTPDGYIYRGLNYTREKIWTQQKIGDKYVSGLIREHYRSDRKVEYYNLTPWIQIAFDELNKNISENGSNPEILKYFVYTQLAGTKDATKDKTPWCAAYVNYCLETSGIEGTGSALAYSFIQYGDDLGNTPAYGSIAIMNYSHVGFVIGQDKNGRIIILGGNQSDALNTSPNDKSLLLKCVYPSDYAPTDLSLPTLIVNNRQLDHNSTR